MKCAFIILVDAFRHNYLSEKHAPFFKFIGKLGLCERFRPLLRYIVAIRASVSSVVLV